MNFLLNYINAQYRPNRTENHLNCIKGISQPDHLTMGKFGDALEEFLLSIPREKLEWFPDHNGTVYKNPNFRLDMQTVGGPHILYTLEIV